MRRWFSFALACCLLAGLGVRAVALAHPISALDQRFIPDDTYYTLSIARSLAAGNGPVAGAGIATGGFQPLLAFVMAPVFWIAHDPDTALRIDLIFLVLCDLASVVLIGLVARRLGGTFAGIVAAATWALSPVAVFNALGGLEASLAVSLELAVLLSWLWLHDAPTARQFRRALVTGTLVGFAVLARVDALILVAGLAVVDLCLTRARPLVAMGVSAMVVVGPWWAYSMAVFGSPIPTSGSAARALALDIPGFSSRATSWAASVLIGGPYTMWWRARRFPFFHQDFGQLSYWALLVLLAVGSLCALVVARKVPELRRRAAGVAGTGLFAAGTLAFYGWYRVAWYYVRYLLPVFACVAILVALGLAELRRAGRVGAVAAPVLATVLVATAAVGAVPLVGGTSSMTANPPALFITGFRGIERPHLARIPRGARVGAYQSGALTYFGEPRFEVFNLDGVVNASAPPPTDPASTLCYMKRKRIGWLADRGGMLLTVLSAIDRGVLPGARAQIMVHGEGFEFLVVRIDLSDARPCSLPSQGRSSPAGN